MTGSNFERPWVRISDVERQRRHALGEALIARLARGLLGRQTGEVVTEVLAGLGTLLGADRAHLLLMQGGSPVRMRLGPAWLAAGVEPPVLEGKTLEDFPCFVEDLRAGRMVVFGAPSDIDPAACEREYVVQAGIGAAVVVPHRSGDRLVSILCVQMMGRPHRWSEADLQLIERIGELLGLAQARQEAEAGLTAILDSIGDAVVAADTAGRVVRINPVAERLTGWTAAAGGQPLATVVALRRGDGTPRPLDPAAIPTRGGDLLRARDGRERRVSTGVATIVAADGQPHGLVVVLRDITEQAVLEERLLTMQHLEAVAQLAGGIAHEFNNLLAGIVGAGELLAETVTPGGREARHVERILVATRRAADLTARLQDFSRRDGGTRHVAFDVVPTLHRALGLAAHALGPAVRPEVRAEGPLPVRGDDDAVVNVLIALLLNARDALPSGVGAITLTAARRCADLAFCTRLGLAAGPGDYAAIEVQDTGSGMPPEVQARLFEPFFTTKGPGRGTGLGLSAVYGTAKSLGGGVEVESRSGVGTTVRLWLPLVGTRAAAAESSPAVATAGPAARVLLVDDDSQVRAVAAEMLRELGHTVREAAGGKPAIEALQADPAAVDLVLLDLAMPDLDGPSVFHALRAIRADLPVLIVSGYGSVGQGEALIAAGARGVLDKPYRLTELAAAVRSALA